MKSNLDPFNYIDILVQCIYLYSLDLPLHDRSTIMYGKSINVRGFCMRMCKALESVAVWREPPPPPRGRPAIEQVFVIRGGGYFSKMHDAAMLHGLHAHICVGCLVSA